MLDPKQLDDLVRRVAVSLPKGAQTLRDDLTRHLRASLEAGLSRLDLVSREEFEVQSAVLARTREKLDRLEARLAELEAQGSTGTTEIDG
jgi:BMFP domain-containing protein YqiC